MSRRILFKTLLNRGPCNRVQLLDACMPHIPPEHAAAYFRNQGGIPRAQSIPLDELVTKGRRVKVYRDIWCMVRDGYATLDEHGVVALTTKGVDRARGRPPRHPKPRSKKVTPRPEDIIKDSLKTHCRHGHEYTPETTRLKKHDDGRIYRACRLCGI